MDFLNNATKQLTDLFASMTPAAKLTAGLLLAVVATSLTFLIRFQVNGGDEFLLGGRVFSETEIAKMEAAFAKGNLTKWEVQANRIRVPRGQKFAFMAALKDENALPEDFNTIFESMLEKDNWFESSEQRKLKSRFAVERQMAFMIEEMSGIESARIKFVEVNEGGFSGKKQRQASVAIRGTSGRELPMVKIESVRDMVANSIGTDRENVVVTDLQSGRAHRARGDGSIGSAHENAYAATKRLFEDHWRDQLYDVLSMYEGVVVGVNVQLNPEVNHTLQSLEYKGQPAAISTSEQTTEETSRNTPPGGRPGLAANQQTTGNTPRSIGATARETSLTERNNQQQNVMGQDIVTKQLAALVPTYVSASVSLPESYFEKIWRDTWKKRNPDAELADMPPPDEDGLTAIKQKTKLSIEETVVSLLPPTEAGVDGFPRVKFTTFHDLPAEPIAPPSVASNAMTWLAMNWQTIGMILLGLCGLFVLRGMISSGGDDSPAAANEEFKLNLANVMDEQDEDEEQPEHGGGLKRRLGDGAPNLREELVDMVKEDPDAAANVLRGWIENAA